jgi:hypothetical protein
MNSFIEAHSDDPNVQQRGNQYYGYGVEKYSELCTKFRTQTIETVLLPLVRDVSSETDLRLRGSVHINFNSKLNWEVIDYRSIDTGAHKLGSLVNTLAFNLADRYGHKTQFPAKQVITLSSLRTMSRLGGGSFGQSRLVGPGGSQTQVLSSSESSIPAAPRSSGIAIQNNGSLPTSHSVSPPPLSTPRMFRRMVASESGSGSLLPDFNNSMSLHRSFSGSSPVPAAVPVTAPSSPVENNSVNNNLRRRSTLQLDQMDVQKLSRNNSLDSNSYIGGGSQIRNNRRAQNNAQPTYQMMHYQGWTLGHLVQTLVVMTIFYLVFDAHHKVSEASLRLEHYKNEETILVNQMDRIEGRAMQLQEQLKRLREDTLSIPEGESAFAAETVQLHKDIAAVKRSHTEVDREVHALQEFLQQGARQEIMERYGSGSVHVNLDLGLVGEDGPKALTIELFEETPHANWVFLQQILQGDWKDSKFIWHPAHMILATPAHATNTKLEFVEKSFHKHQAWTVGLTPSENGSYNFFVNLLDNGEAHEGDVCLGKIVGGFDALQRLMHVPITTKSGHTDFLDPPVTITSIAAKTVKRSRTKRR